jgi:phenylalanyl-tRNA synthetase beta chain
MRRIDDLLAGAGLEQVVTYAFGDDRWPDALGLPSNDSRRQGIVVTNPLSGDQSVMRTMLLPGLLAAAQRNVSVRQESVPIFEVGRTYLPSGEELPHEPVRIGMLVVGPWETASWLHSGVTNGYFLGKGLVERLADGLHGSLAYSRVAEPFLHPGRSAAVASEDGNLIGWLGEIHPLVAERYDLSGPVVAAELDVATLLAASARGVGFRDLLAYPVVEQDLAVVVDAGTTASAVVDSLRRAGGDLLEDVQIFDLYEGSQVGKGKKSVALRLSFRAKDRTLSEVEVNRLRSDMLKRAASEVGATLRS